MFYFNIFLALMSLSVVTILGGCTPAGLATGAGATAGVAAAREGGIKSSLTDARINADISDRWFKYDLNTFAKLNITVNQGRVLLTGVVQDPQDRVEAVRLAWQAEGVKQLINEIRIADSEGLKGYLKDTWVSAQIRTSLTFDRDVQSLNFSVDTVQGVVYLMGVAQNQSELDRVKAIARSTSNVDQVVSYIKIAGPKDS